MKKGIKIAGIAIVLAGTVFTGIHFLSNKAVATNANYKVQVESYVAPEEESSTYDAAGLIAAEVSNNNYEQKDIVVTTEAAPETTTEATSVVPTDAVATETATASVATQEDTQQATEATTAATTAAVAQPAAQAAPTQAATQAPTAAPTVAPTEAPTQAPTQAVQTVTYTNVTFTNGATGEKSTFSTLEEAKAAINMPTLTSDEAKAQGASNKAAYAATIDEMIGLINSYRASLGLGAVTYNDNLTNAAMERAAESAYANWNMTAYEGDAKRHIRPNYTKASTIATEYGISGNFAEIYARFQANAGEAVQGWQNSSAHNAVLTSANYTEVGVGIAVDSDGYYYWICLFN